MNEKHEKQRSVPEGYVRKRVSFRLVGSCVDTFPEEWSDRRIIESVFGPLNNLTIKSPFEGNEGDIDDGHRFSVELDEVTDVSDEGEEDDDGEGRKVVIQPPCSLEQMLERTRALQQKHREEAEKFWSRFHGKQQQ